MNQRHYADNLLQFEYLLNIVRAKKRFSKWVKPTEIEDLDCIKEYYGYSNEKAKSVLSLLTGDQIKQIKNRMKKGGRTK